MKHIPKICLILFITFNLTKPINAQVIEVGTLHEGSKKYDPKIVGEDEELVYVLSEVSSKQRSIEAYEKKNRLNKKYSLSIDHEKIENKYPVEIEKVVLLQDHFLIFYSYYDAKSHLYYLFIKTVVKEDGSLKENRKDLFNIEVESKYRKGDYTVLLSQDKSKIFIYHRTYNRTYRKYFRQYTLMNEDLEVLFSKELEENEFMPKNYLIDNDGSIFYVYNHSGLHIGSFDANRDYERWEEKTQFMDQHSSPVNIQTLIMTISSKNELVITGLVADVDENVVGSGFILLDHESKEIKLSQVSYFSEEFYDQFRTSENIKNKSEGVFPNSLRRGQVLKKADGGYIMILERYKNKVYRGQHDNSVIGEDFLYGSILVINYDNNGNMLWSNFIPKKQWYSWECVVAYLVTKSSQGLGFISKPNSKLITRHFSYSAGIFNDKLIIAFYDDIKNIKQTKLPDKLKTVTVPSKAVVVKHEIDLKTGTVQKGIYEDFQKTNTYFCPQDNLQSAENKDMVIFGIKKKKYSYSLLKKNRF
ncbi:MAG: hypothetical protein ACK4ND_07520 [Cytophagaceae bacterium]